MALSKTGLRDRIKAKLDTAFGAMAEPGDTYRTQFALAIAEAVVDEITTNGKARIAGESPGPGLGQLQRWGPGPDDTDAPPFDVDIPLV